MNNLATLIHFIGQLQEIAQEADRERLSVWLPQFEAEYPDIADEINYCARMGESSLVLPYLRERYAPLDLACKTLPRDWTSKLQQAITFLHSFVRERYLNDQSNS